MNTVFSRNEEDFSYTDLHDVLDSLYSDEELKVGAVYWEAEAIQHAPSHYFSMDRMLEDMGCAAYDDGGEHAEDFPDIKKSDSAELEKIIKDFLDEKLSVSFWRCKDVKQMAVTQEMIDEYNRIAK